MNIPLTEMIADLGTTERDIEALNAVVENLQRFTQDSHGEDRSVFRMDVFKYQALLNQATRLRHAIQSKIDEVTK
jgi:hypothetical protein